MRLQRPIFVRKPVAEVRLRLVARDLPEDAQVDVTDVQLQPGERPTGVTVNVREVGTQEGGTQYRNGVVHGGMEVIAMANVDRASPTRLEVTGGPSSVQVGSYRFTGSRDGRAWVDGRIQRANDGWGHAPVITQRSDLYLRTKLEGRAHLLLEWEDREP